MKDMQLLRLFIRTPRYVVKLLDLYTRIAWLRIANRFKRRPITEAGGPVVSMTTYGKRVRSVHLAIESIAQGQKLPSRFILWLDDASILSQLPPDLRRLQKRGLEVRLCEDYGPHKKYYPYLESLHEVALPLVTADDDVLYPRSWLKELHAAFLQFPTVVNCHRARVVEVSSDGIGEYRTWGLVGSTEPSFRHFAIGVGGVLYPPDLQDSLKCAGAAFATSCPRGDDIWLHVQSIRAGYKVRQVNRSSFRLVYIPGTQSGALHISNLSNGGNDSQIALTYQSIDIDRLRSGI